MIIDTTCILIALAILAGSLSAAMLLIWRFLLPQRSMMIWGTAMGCYGSGTLLAASWPLVPPLFSITLANLFIVGCCALVWWGCSLYSATGPCRRTILVSLALFTLIQGWFTHVVPDIACRTLNLSLFIIFYLAGALATLLRKREHGLTMMERVVATVLLFNVASRILVAGFQLSYLSYRAPLPDNGIIQLSALAALLGVTCWGLSVILLTLERTIDDLRGTERDSRAARNLLETVIDNIPSLIYLKDRLGRLLVCNQGLADLVGVSRAEAIGRTSHDFFPPSVADRQADDDVAVLTDGRMLVTEETVELADGRHVFETKKLPVRDQRGDVTSICGISTDVTEQNRIAERLREAELRLNAFVQSQIIGIVVADTAGAFLEMNDAFLAMLGYTREEFDRHGLRWDAITPPEYAEQDRRIVRQIRDRLLAPPWEKEYFHRDGRRVPVLAGAAGFKRIGDEVRAVCFILDLTERKRAEEALRESQQLFDTIANTSPSMIWISGLDKGCTWFNRTWLDFTGRSMDQERGDGWAVGVHPDDLQRCLAVYSEAFDARSFFVMEYRLRRHDGEYRWILDQGHPRFDATGAFAGYIGSCLDIGDWKEAQEEIERKNREIEQFIYAVSHDLRSPLVTFKSFLAYMEEDIRAGDTHKVEQDLSFIHAAADKMERLLTELLEMSRIGRHENQPTTVTFGELAREALAAVAGQIAERRVSVQVADVELTLTGDRPRLAQIWQNLLDNAVKYRGDQPLPRIELGVDRLAGETVFFVRDNGMGIAPEYREKVFGMFDKLDGSSAGVGLGLAMVKKIVEKYRGRIWVESAGAGGGACFRFTLPDALPPLGGP